MTETHPATRPEVGSLVREWRQRRHLSQLALSLDAEISTRHLSFIETGRSRPSREMLLKIAEQLQVPLRERNTLLLAGGYAPAYLERPLDAAEMRPVREAIEQILAAHEPHAALLVNRRWDLIQANSVATVLLEGVPSHLLEPPINVLRVTLHPDGLARRILNFEELSSHLIARLQRHVALSGDPKVAELLAELCSYPDVSASGGFPEIKGAQKVFIPLRLRIGDKDLSLLSTISTFGAALDITLDELSIESFYPADAGTATFLRDRTALAARAGADS